MENYFGMDSFNRITETAYCMNNIRSKEVDILPQTAVAQLNM